MRYIIQHASEQGKHDPVQIAILRGYRWFIYDNEIGSIVHHLKKKSEAESIAARWESEPDDTLDQ